MPDIDRLYSTSQAGQMLGGLSAEAVNQLGRDGKLELVAQVVRGKGKSPRRFVRASELNRYINELRNPDKRSALIVKNKRCKHPGFAKELAEATKYY